MVLKVKKGSVPKKLHFKKPLPGKVDVYCRHLLVNLSCMTHTNTYSYQIQYVQYSI